MRQGSVLSPAPRGKWASKSRVRFPVAAVYDRRVQRTYALWRLAGVDLSTVSNLRARSLFNFHFDSADPSRDEIIDCSTDHAENKSHHAVYDRHEYAETPFCHNSTARKSSTASCACR